MKSTRYHDPYLATLDRPVSQRLCDSPGCGQGGHFRAPRSRDKLNEYYWFCFDHVRDYNRNWNYLEGLSEEEIEECIRGAAVWERPTWPLGEAYKKERKLRDEIKRAFFSDAWDETESASGQNGYSPAIGEREALMILGLEPPLEFSAVKEHYRALVKLHHPDINGGSREAEEKLKIINHAFTTLKGIYEAQEHG